MPPQFSEHTRIVVSADQVSAPVASDVVILGMKDAVYYGLDSVGARIWTLIAEPRSLGEVAAVLEAEFDVTRERALADLIKLAGDLAARGLIEVVDASPAA
ncbi:MAG: PqqD family protein [Gemmatimonadetes bacterium]|nr:PqqD family protein [Gemmatimonadota bacterium]